jgi:RimJ/RimL family protein N-acetyltransferase
MCKFIQLNSPANFSFVHCIPKVKRLFIKYFGYIQDDFSCVKNINDYIFSLRPFFWLILDYDENFMGFVYLDNIVGGNNEMFSAELTTVFEPAAWGSFTRYSAKIFLKKCFDELNLQKITANIYPDNYRVKNLLKDAGFTYETTLKNATKRNGKFQDIDIYAIYRSYYM